MEPETANRQREASRGERFDGVKLELALVMLLALAAAVVVAVIDAPSWLELLALTLVGFAGGGWVAFRARRVAAHGEREDG